MAASAEAALRSGRERCGRLLPGTGLRQDGRDWRGRTAMEEAMRLFTMAELMRLTRRELCDLRLWISTILPTLPKGSVERDNALINLRNIRWVLARRDYSP
jgi:hypothetical protein